MSDPRFVLQTKIDAPELGVNGNCYAACLASILGLPLERIPAFEDTMDQPGWFLDVQRWLMERWGFVAVAFDGDPGFVGVHYIAVGPGPRGATHAVVHMAGELVHDPNPEGGGLLAVESVELLVDMSAMFALRDEARAASLEENR